MSEQSENAVQQNAEQRVFGDAFTFSEGVASPEAVAKYFEERDKAIAAGDIVWKVRGEFQKTGIIADLYRNTGTAAIMLYDIEKGGTAYGTSRLIGQGDTTLCEGTGFEETVDIAEDFVINASKQDEISEEDLDY